MASQAARLRRARGALAAAVLALMGSAACAAMTIEEAYVSANHRRTPFEATGAAIPADAGAALSRLFGLTDQGVVLRIESMRGATAAQRYDTLISALRAEAFAGSIAKARDEVVEALVLQRRVAATGASRMSRADLAKTPDVTAASRKLHSAYDLLVRGYPGATPRQRQAFYDHLCALDYL